MGEPVRQQGQSATGRSRWSRWVRPLSGLLAAGALLTCGTLPASARTAAVAGHPAAPALPAASAEYPAVVSLDSVTPRAVTPQDRVTVTGRITNGGPAPIKDVEAGLRTARSIGNRSTIDAVTRRNDPQQFADGTSITAGREKTGTLAPGESRAFTVSLPVADLKPSRGGLLELAVDAIGRTQDDDEARPLGIGRTFLPYTTEPNTHPTQLAVVWPITHAPALVAQSMGTENDQTAVLRDDSLATELAPGGRLYQLVQTGKDLAGLTWVIDPDLLDTVLAMTRGYQVQKPGTAGESAKPENTVAGAGRDAATEWLKLLRTAVGTAGSQVVSLPYADPDLASIAHNGEGLSGMDTALRKAQTAGEVTTEGRLSVNISSNVSWPYQGQLDQQVAALARSTGNSLVLANGRSLPDDRLDYTPNAARPIGNGQTAVVADATVSELFQQDLSTPQAQNATIQRFLAETMVINHQRPDTRTLLVLPPRNLGTAAADTLAKSVAAAQQGGWAKLVGLAAVANAPADPNANSAVPSPGQYPHQLRAGELSTETLAQVMGIQGKLDQLLFILTQPQKVRGPFNAAMVRSMSTEWRDQGPAGSTYRAGVQNYLDNLIGAVKLTPKSTVTLAGDNGIVLVSMKNDLNQAVGNLRIRLTSSQPNRVFVSRPEPVVVEAVTSRTLRFNAKAKSNGPVPMTAQLETTNGRPYGEPMAFTVEVTSVTSGVLYVIGGGVLLMLLAGVRFTLQRRKRADEPHEDPEALLEAPGTAGAGNDRAAGAGATEAAGGADRAASAGTADRGGEQSGTPAGARAAATGGTPQESGAGAGEHASGDEKVGH
ncbi:DUF6049 family protein [Kitasatospora sp. NPDC096147]|uniref:DUF6049 family protein n=1 Tax=Kitasatospora sp. NPDC096147 TaxID=3364093 RepID=UPI0038023F24